MGARSKQYNPADHEEAVYRRWEADGAFTANAASEKPPFAISMPPPNATGRLHIGHAARMTVQDVLIRAARMQGYEALWLPGTDHAAIATESVVIRRLQQEGITDPRQEFGREKLVTIIAQYVKDSRSIIKSQIRRIGASCDWSRERYTMEPAMNQVVRRMFSRMYRDGLIYRGMRIVNWDPVLQTTVSDDEVERVEEETPFYYFQYGPFVIGTARPETKFGDKYVVMHPDDERYSHYSHGDTFTAEWINGPVTATVIKDNAVDPTFGTGVMTITPWHDQIDFEIAERHGLDKEQIIGFDGKLLDIAGEFAGQTIAEARTKIVDKLKSKELLVRVDESYLHSKAVNSRGKGTIEPQIKLQWFIDVNKPAVSWPLNSNSAKSAQGGKKSLKEIMQQVVRDKEVRLLPDRYEKLYFHWVDNLRDWCISRQIWWGHRIPVWYRDDEIQVGEEPAGDGWEQDPDTLDTWFSSGLWTFSTLIDRRLTEDAALSLSELLKNSPDFQKFHPTAVLETAYDILFFWVARMIMMTVYATGQIPFKQVLLHGLITGSTGKKMSKSDPNSVIDPLAQIERHGADALRFGLIYQLNYGSQAVKFDEEAVTAARNFANKIWNIARLLDNLQPWPLKEGEGESATPTIADVWIADELARTAEQVTVDIKKFRLGDAAHTIHTFLWNQYADWYLEILKTGGSTATARRVFADTLALLHPFMPHLTELLWEDFRQDYSSGLRGGEAPVLLINAPWPEASVSADAAAAHRAMERFKDIITAVRSARTLFAIPPAETVRVHIPGSCPLPAAAAALGRAQIIEKAEDGMQPLPLNTGGIAMLAAPSLTAAARAAAAARLDAEAAALQERAGQIAVQLKRMRGKAPAGVISEKEQIAADAARRLEEIAASRRLLV